MLVSRPTDNINKNYIAEIKCTFDSSEWGKIVNKNNNNNTQFRMKDEESTRIGHRHNNNK